ncbi:hypothetical protein IE81DRAFT_365031 [Ceraceosorus guamensis]|uniref:Uncharacterized protein n=1 Tax=Ceraceosorus guamensis TaxID=1522189 RepID=A0A316W3I1_9BASI|nr:hypothetical protein IE81DRAFT_365031 [Ceraceosorus guamensis]PWN44282.1 hypothetical protein IE81DRAFT_365031 [Ceraceosorus guamensis]
MTLRPHRLTPTELSIAVSEDDGLEPSASTPPPSFPLASSSVPLCRRDPATASPMTLPEHAFFDLIVIGAGPASLALVARLLEERPAAIYTEDEHRHLHWLKKSGKAGNISRARTIKTRARGSERVISTADDKSGYGSRAAAAAAAAADTDGDDDRDCECQGLMRILVIDRLGGWMKQWDNAFRALQLEHLRSPLFFHPAPADLDALLAFAERHGCASCPDADHNASGSLTKPSRAERRQRRRQDGETAESLRAEHHHRHVAPPGYSLREIANCVGKEISKHRIKSRQKRQGKAHSAGQPAAIDATSAQGIDATAGYARMLRDIGPAVNERDRKDYHVPSTKLFRDFVQQEVVERYGLDGEWRDAHKVWKGDNGHPHGGVDSASKAQTNASSPITLAKGEVSELHWGELHVEGWDHMQGFCIKTEDGSQLGSKAVVCALGMAGGPALPQFITRPQSPSCAGDGWCHSSAIFNPSYQFPPAASKVRGKTCVIVGGGLTTAQTADLALRRGFDHVEVIMRGHMKVKPFDIGLEWMGRYANLAKMRFFQEEDAATRLAMVRCARQGGSITPPWAARLRALEQQGKVTIRTHTKVDDAVYDKQYGQWDLKLCTKMPLPRKKCDACELHKEPEVQMHRVRAAFMVCATGSQQGFSALPFAKAFALANPLPEAGGLPCLTDSLQWGREVPLFFVGALAGLQIGPAAGNLGGMREAAERVAVRLGELSLGIPPSPALLSGTVLPSQDRKSTIGSKADVGTESRGSDHASHLGFTHFGFETLPVEV